MSQPKKSEISERFILYRKRAGLNQSQLGEVLGISNDYVSLIETGRREPGPSLLKLFTSLEEDQHRKLDETSDSVGTGMELRETPRSPVPTPADCIRYLETYLKEVGGDLGKTAWVYHELKNRFPLSSDLERIAAQHVPGAESEFEQQHGGGGRGRTSRKSRRAPSTSPAPTPPAAPDRQDQK